MSLRGGPLELRRRTRRRHCLQLHHLPPLRRSLSVRLGGGTHPRLRPAHAYIRGKTLGFHFCTECACVAYWRALKPGEDGRRRIAVNLRLAEPEGVAGIVIDHFDGLDSFDDLPRDGRCVADMWF